MTGRNLQAQYERWQPRAKYRQALDPTVEQVRKVCMNLRRSAKVLSEMSLRVVSVFVRVIVFCSITMGMVCRNQRAMERSGYLDRKSVV